ncbi:MAG: PAS domain S-box protein [Rhodocyclaceae bacterium]
MSQSEKLLQLFVRHAPAAIAMFDRDMRYIVVSQRFLDDYRIAGDVIGRTHYDVFPEIPEHWRQLHRRALAGEVLRAEEDPFPRADGRLDWVRWDIRPWNGDDGQIGGIILFTENITQRKLAEEALRESERRLRETLDNLKMVAIALDEEGRLTYCNDHFLALTGWSRAESTGQDWFRSFLPGKIVEPLREMYSQAMRENWVPIHFENEIVTRAGHRRLVSWTNTLTLDAAGKVNGAICLGEDITERRRAEAALRDSEERFRAIANHTADWESWFDPQGRLVWVSPSVERFTGYTPDELYALPGSVPGLLCDEGESDLALALQSRADGEAGGEFECRCARKDGSQFWLSVTWQPIYDRNGTPLGVRTSGRDITARRNGEEEIRRLNTSLEERVAERTEAQTTAIKELESFSYATAHDLRTPLRGIEGFSAILEADYGGRLDAAGQEYLQRIRRAAQHMAQRIDDLRDLTLVSRHPLRKEVIDLSRMAREVIAQIRASGPQRAIQIEVVPCLSAYADGALLRRMLKEIFLNAWKFTEPTVAPHIAFGAETRSGETVYFVRDNGVGFDMHYAKRLFQPFQRLHGPGEFAGNGIGLASVQRIVTRHGGRVWAQSVPGEGTTIYFTLEARTRTTGPEPLPSELQAADGQSNLQKGVEGVAGGDGPRPPKAALRKEPKSLLHRSALRHGFRLQTMRGR